MWLDRQSEIVLSKIRNPINQILPFLPSIPPHHQKADVRGHVPVVEVAMALEVQKDVMAARLITIVSISPLIEVLRPSSLNGAGLSPQRQKFCLHLRQQRKLSEFLLLQRQIPPLLLVKIVERQSRHFGVGMSTVILSAMPVVSIITPSFSNEPI